MSCDEWKRDRPHDLLFRYVFSQVRHARGALRHLVGKGVAEHLDWSTLRHEPGAYVEEHLRDSYSDLPFSIELRDEPGQIGAIIVWEHVRKPRRLMPLHLLNYGGRALRDHARGRHAVPGRLPQLIPVVLHQGSGRWPGPRRLTELHGKAGRRSPLPTFVDLRMIVHELRHDSIPPHEITSVARTALRLLWLVSSGGMTIRNARRVARWVKEVHDDGTAERDDLHALLEYIYRTKENEGMLEAIMEHVDRELRTEFVSVADKLEARGKAGLVLRQLGQRFGGLPPWVELRVRSGSLDELDAWGSRLLEASTLGEVFGDA